MIQLTDHGMYLVNGVPQETAATAQEEARRRTMAWQILQAHNVSPDPMQLRIRFDAMVSHDITYVGIIQQARASGMKEFPIPYALTNCHNSLCAVGGTINEDDHMFGLSAAKKYGGIYVPANQSVIHSYAREQMAKCGSMILGSDSHTRYGALGTMAVGEGGPELAKQLLKNTWDTPMPKVVLVYLTGTPRQGIGPHDVAIALVKATFESGFVNNCVLEFAGPGIKSLPIDFRNGIDVMTTETTCLSSIWETDEVTRGFYEAHKRPEDYKPLHPGQDAYYDKMITIDLSRMESMIALPFHPSNAWTIHEFLENAEELLQKVDIIAPNREELNEICPDIQGIDEQADFLLRQGVGTVVVTLGAKGCYIRKDGQSRYFPAVTFPVFDASGAADAFLSALTAYLYRGVEIAKAVEIANYAAGYSVSKEGVIPSLISRQELDGYVQSLSRKNG